MAFRSFLTANLIGFERYSNHHDDNQNRSGLEIAANGNVRNNIYVVLVADLTSRMLLWFGWRVLCFCTCFYTQYMHVLTVRSSILVSTKGD
jgi:hypothetical protein